MNDPHVEKLYYQFISENLNDIFEKAEPLKLTIGSFDVELCKGILIVSPQQHFASEESAKTAFQPFLDSWKTIAFLSPSKFRINFLFEKSEIIDRKPNSGNVSLYVGGISTGVSFGKATLSRIINKYPAPDDNFVVSPLIDELVFRLQQYKDGKQTLPQVSYYILEKLEKEFVKIKIRKRKELSKILIIEFAVLDKIGNFSNKPDAKIGRHAALVEKAITSKELRWLEEAIFKLVKRVGEYYADSENLPLILMSDLPEL
jgi:hypothetical protein